MTPTLAGRSQFSRVKSLGSLEPNSSELLNYLGLVWFPPLGSSDASQEGCSQMTDVNYSLGATNPPMGLGAAIYSRGAIPRERT